MDVTIGIFGSIEEVLLSVEVTSLCVSLFVWGVILSYILLRSGLSGGDLIYSNRMSQQGILQISSVLPFY